MARKYMTKEVTQTVVKSAIVKMVVGEPKAVELPDEIILGNVSMAHAQTVINKKYNQPVTIFALQPETKVYEMEVEEFIKLARLKEVK